MEGGVVVKPMVAAVYVSGIGREMMLLKFLKNCLLLQVLLLASLLL